MHLPLTHVRVQMYMMCIVHATYCILCIWCILCILCIWCKCCIWCMWCLKVETHLTTDREIKDWHQSRCWKLIFECKFSNHVLPNKIPTFDTSCFNYVVFRYWRVAWLVDPDLKIYISRTALQILPSPIGSNTYIVWSMIETVIY